MSEFTPGPWVFNGWERVRPVNGKDDGTDDICHVYGAGKPTEANGKLLAAAPELYEACDECLHALRALIVHGQLSDDSIDYLEKKLNAALNKADGEQKARGE
jgi:hypothetical protein